MADVAQRVVTANAVKNGYVLAGVDKFGNKQVLTPTKVLRNITVAAIETQLTNKFDDVNYYQR